jgi:hypothetical protein
VLFCCIAVPQAWQRSVPREVLEGLLGIEQLRRQHGLKGVAGCLVDLLDVPPQLVTAADVVAGNQLFQVRGGSTFKRTVLGGSWTDKSKMRTSNDCVATAG